MAKIIELRVAKLEARFPSPPEFDLRRMTDAELHELLFASLRRTVSDPTSSFEQVQRARRMLNQPWGMPDWSVEDLVFLCREAHKDD